MVSTEKILHLRTIKKKYITAEKLNRFRAKIPDGERRIGSLPYDWIKRIEKIRFRILPAVPVMCLRNFL